MNRLGDAILVACAWLSLSAVLFAQAPTSVLPQIPGDARGFVLVRGLDAIRGKIDALATRVQAPLPKLNNMLAAFDKGLDKQRSLGVVWLPERDGDDARSALTHFVLYIPVKNYAEFVEQLGAEDASARITEGAISSQPVVVAKKGDYAIVAQFEDKGSLEHVLNAESRFAYRAGESGLTNDAQVKKTSSLLPSSAQWICYVSPSGAIQFVTQMSASFLPEADFELPKYPASPPIGFAAELTRSHLDGQLVVPMETIDAVMEFVAEVQQLRQ